MIIKRYRFKTCPQEILNLGQDRKHMERWFGTENGNYRDQQEHEKLRRRRRHCVLRQAGSFTGRAGEGGHLENPGRGRWIFRMDHRHMILHVSGEGILRPFMFLHGPLGKVLPHLATIPGTWQDSQSRERLPQGIICLPGSGDTWDFPSRPPFGYGQKLENCLVV